MTTSGSMNEIDEKKVSAKKEKRLGHRVFLGGLPSKY